jgi:hypothetical protein
MVHKKSPTKVVKTPITPKHVLFSIAIAVVVAGSIYLLTTYAGKVFYEQPRAVRVHEIYHSLNLPKTYIYQSGQIAGEERFYNQDGTRSWSSYQYYYRGASLSQTVTELDLAITKAGFTFFEQPRKEAPEVQRHYKNDRGEYVRITAYSKPRAEYYQNTHIMGESTTKNTIDPDTGPIVVIIKVNLDTNNE